MTADELAALVRAELAAGSLDLPDPGCGSTTERLLRLAEFGRRDLSFARLAEPHVDASSILHDLGRTPSVRGVYGVWASGGPAATLVVHRDGDGWLLEGVKPFCSGASICDAALVTAEHASRADGALVEVDLRAARASGALTVDTSAWATTAFCATGTASIHVEGLHLPAAAVVGSSADYLDRPGFWHGALGPAAVWAGGVQGLADAVAAAPVDLLDAHRRAAAGGLAALSWSVSAWLRTAGAEVDASPDDAVAARRTAIVVRHLIQRVAVDAVDLHARVGGPRVLAFDAEVVRRVQELQLYVRQFHGGIELEELAGWNEGW
jgi:alkylation response protein AidB-like acyl-CoA dehydrogenase